MARPPSDRITVRYLPGRPLPWGAFWRAIAVDGGRLRRSKYFATEAEALQFKAEAEADAATLPPPALTTTASAPRAGTDRGSGFIATARPGSLTFRQFADNWLAIVVARRKPATVRSYTEILKNHVYPHLGAIRVSPATLGVQPIVTLLALRAQAGVKWGSQKAILRVVSSCLRWAVRYQHLSSNPALGLLKDLKDESAPEYADPEPNPLTASQADAFLVWLQTGTVPASVGRPALWVDGPRLRGGTLRTPGYPEWYPYFLALLRTGMRRGEAAALKWSTVDLDRGRARLESNYSPSARAAGDGQATGDVSLKGKRPHDIDLAPALVEALRELARTRRADALAAGRKVSPYLFVSRRGARVLSDSATAERVFARGMEALGLTQERHTIHDCRDSFATLHLLQDPGRLFWVSWMLGHRHTSTTLNRYTKFVPALTGGNQFAGALDAPSAKAKVEGK